MRVPISWLREYVDLPRDTDEIAHRLAMLGFPVEDVIRRPKITGVVVGKIVELQKHPNADRLQVGIIDVGGAQPLTIATAATNVAAGQVIPVATIGAKLPQLTIEPRKMRGIASEGMMVSADELALPPEWFEDGIVQLEPDAKIGGDVVAAYGLDDDVLEVEVTSNRVDAMCVTGLARELAASYGVELRLPPAENPGTAEEPADRAVGVAIESPDCRRFVAQRFDGIATAPAPAWMRIKLALAGQRPINNLVDVSNYVMLETGQPLHFYDAAKISGGKLIVRDGREGERTVTLDDVERTLSPLSLVIADDRQTLCLAGLMGAAAGEVTDSTTSIVLEAANFSGARVRRMSKALALRSEASSRHEKTLPLALTDAGAARAAHLLVALGATAYRPHAFGSAVEPQAPIELKLSDVKRLLGIEIPADRVAAHLRSLGCTVAQHAHVVTVTPPLWRNDLTIPADAIEEIARVEGYENIPSVVPSVPAHDISSAQYALENRVAAELDALAYYEIVTYSLVGRFNADSVEVLDPLSEDQRYLRTSILPAMLEYFARHDSPVRVFEIGHNFRNENGLVVETPVATFGFTVEAADEPSWHDTPFLRLKGDCEALLRRITGRSAEVSRDVRAGFHPGKTAVLIVDGHEVAHLGRIDPRATAAAGVRFPAYACTVMLDRLPDYRIPQYAPPSKFPSTYRDLALEVDLELTAADVERSVAETLGPMCTGVRVFDEYRGPQVQTGHKSVAVRITLQRFDATITDEEADAAIERVLAALRERGAVIRQ
ncbi:MAG TPA: phenylalanine--tRNA ligase subunit beta [Candidatus Baltobacteraceae bacterium]|nr:phenylalanine--tRNA ligase subunit beta [Candidatus Baltobacteraceae bacterium]